MSVKTTRRGLLRRSAAAGSGLVLPTLIPARVLPAPGRVSPNDKIACGLIGAGGRGLAIAPKDTIAVADVDKNHVDRAVKKFGESCTGYTDYRKLLERKDIDAIFCGSPDHWHALITIHACQAGKDVYCEKPACCTIPEGRSMIAAARKYKRVVQIGSQGRSTEGAWLAKTFIANNQCGRITKVLCWHPPNPEGGDPGKNASPPAHLDWDFWLGPAKERSYNPDYHPGSFRWYLDLGGGNIRDRGAHIMSVALYLLNADNAWPVTVEAVGTKPRDGALRDVPPRMEVTYEFKSPDWTLSWRQPGVKFGTGQYGAKYEGEKESLIVNGGDGGTTTEDKAKQFKVPENGVQVFRSPGHHQNFFDCIRSRETPIMPVEAGVKVAALNNMGNAVYIAGRDKGEPLRLTWDPTTEMFKGAEAKLANDFLHRPAREKYRIPLPSEV